MPSATHDVLFERLTRLVGLDWWAEQFVERNFVIRADIFGGCLPGLDAEQIRTRLRENEQTATGAGMQIPFEAINEPGCFICNWSGHLLRIPDDAVKPNRSPVVSMKGLETLFVTKISNDPYVPVTKARLLAADCDVTVNF